MANDEFFDSFGTSIKGSLDIEKEKEKATKDPNAKDELWETFDLNTVTPSSSGYHDGLDPADYDFALKSGDFNNDLFRAQNQSWGEQLGNAAARTALSIVPEVIGSVASILDFEDYWNQDNEIGNSITRAMNEAKEDIAEATPIYRTNPNKPLDVGDSAWWFENGSGLVTSAAAFAITGFGVGAGLTKGAQALKWVALASKGKKAVGAVKKVTDVTNVLGTSLALNQAEGMLTAIDIYDTTFRQGLEKGLSQEEARQLAASAGSHSINVNRINVALNLTSSSAFLSGLGKGGSRYILKKEALGKQLFSEGAQEYGEEVINLYAENEGKRLAERELRGGTLNNPDTAGDRLLKTFFSLEGLEAGLLGAVGGVMQTGFTHLGKNILPKHKAENAKLMENIKKQKTAIETLDKATKEQGAPNLTTALVSLNEVSELVKRKEELVDTADRLVEAGKDIPDNLAKEITVIGDQILQHQSFTAFSQGLGEHLENAYQEIASMSTEKAVARGFKGPQLNEKSPSHYKKAAEDALVKIKKYEKRYNEHFDFRNSKDILVNRITYDAGVEALNSIRTDMEQVSRDAIGINDGLPLRGNETRPLISDFDRLAKEGTKQEKTYVTYARKNPTILAYEEQAQREKGLQTRLEILDKEYNHITSLAKQQQLESKEREKVEEEAKKKVDEEVKAAKTAEALDAEAKTKEKEDVNIAENAPTVTTEPEIDEVVQKSIEVSEESASPEGIVVSEEGESPDTTIEDNEGEDVKTKIAQDKKVLKDALDSTRPPGEELYDDENERKVQEQTNNLVKELDKNNKETTKAFSIAYRAKGDVEGDYTGDEILDAVNTDILDIDKIKPGTKVTIKIDESYNGTGYNYEGKWQVAKANMTPEMLVDFTPIAIMYDGKIIGHLHEPQWITKKTLYNDTKNVSKEQQKVRLLRQHILENGEVTTTINHTGPGVLSKGETIIPLSEAMPGAIVAVVENSHINTNTDKKYNIVNEKAILSPERNQDGFTMALIPVNKNKDGETQYMGVPMGRKTLDERAQTSILKVIRYYMDSIHFPEKKNAEFEKLADEIETVTEYDIRTSKGLSDYIKLFTHNFVDNVESSNATFTMFMQTKSDLTWGLSIYPDGVAFGNGGNPEKGKPKTVVPMNYKDNPGLYMGYIQQNLHKVYGHVNKNSLSTGEITIPYITEDGKIDSASFTGTYEEYVSKNVLTTNLRSHTIGSEKAPKQAYTIQRVVTIDTSFMASKGAKQKSGIKEVEATDTKLPIIPNTEAEIEVERTKVLAEKANKIVKKATIYENAVIIQMEDGSKGLYVEEKFIHSYPKEESNEKILKINELPITEGEIQTKEEYYNEQRKLNPKRKTLEEKINAEFDKRLAEIKKIESPKKEFKSKVLKKKNYGALLQADKQKKEDSNDVDAIFAQAPSSPITSDYVIKGISVTTQTLITNNLIADVIEYAEEVKKEEDARRAADLPLIEESLDIGKELDNAIEELAEAYPEIKAEKAKMKEIVRLTLQKYIQVALPTELNEEAQSLEDKGVVWGENPLTVNPKDKLSFRIKRVFGLTPDIDENGIVRKTGDFVHYVEQDRAYKAVIDALSETYQKNHRVLPNYEAMKKELEAQSEHTPFLQSLIDKLDAASDQVKTEFVKLADLHYVDMFYVRMGESITEDGDIYFYMNIWNDNANSKTRTIKDAWRRDSLWTSRLNNKDNPHFSDPKIREELLATYNKWVEEDNYPIIEVKEWLRDMGMKVTTPTLEAFLDEENSILDIDYKYHFTAKKGIFYRIRNSLLMLSETQEIADSTLYTGSAITELSKVEARNNPVFVANSYRSANKTMYAHSLHKYATQRTAELKYDIETLNQLAKLPNSQYATWLRGTKGQPGLLKVDEKGEYIKVDGNVQINTNSYFYQNFQMGYVGQDALQDADVLFKNLDKAKLSDLDVAKHLQAKMGMFQNKGNKNGAGERTVKYFFPTMSDKDAVFLAFASAIDIKLNKEGGIKRLTTRKIIDAILLPEIARMNTFSPGRENIMSYDEGAMMFYSMPELNNIDALWGTTETGGKYLKLEVGLSDTGLNTILEEAVEKHLNRVIQDQVETLIDAEIYNPKTGIVLADNAYLNSHIDGINSKKDDTAFTARLVAADFAINNMIANANFNQLFVSDIAQYYIPSKLNKADPNYYIDIAKQTFLNVGKRLAGLSGPGISPVITDGEKTTYTQLFLADRKGPSLALDYYKRIWGENSDQVKQYDGSKESPDLTDAQEYNTVAEKLRILRGEGKIDNREYNRLYNKYYKKGKDFTTRDLSIMEIFQPDKPLYVGPHYGANSSVERKVYIKSSSITLLRQFSKGLEIDKLRDLMENKDISRAAFSSAVKVGNVKNPLEIWNKDGTIKDNIEFNAEEHTLDLEKKYFRIQQEMPYDANKDEIKRVSQASKLAFVNILEKEGFVLEDIKNEDGSLKPMTGMELREKFLNAWKTMYSNSLQDLVEELDISKNIDGWELNEELLIKKLKKEAEQRGFSAQDLEGLRLFKNEDGSVEFEMPLWASGANSAYESLLNSLVNNSVLTQKMPGKSYVLGSEEGFMAQEDAINEFGDLVDAGVIPTDNFTGQLNPSNPDEGLLDNQILIPWPFKGVSMKDYIVDGKIDMSKIDEDLLKMYGMRIPNQGPNSTGNIEVVGFLPEIMGDIIITPRDFITQMGSDFDIDKLYTYMFNYMIEESGSLKRVKNIDINKVKIRIERLEKQLGTAQILAIGKDRFSIIKNLKQQIKHLQKFTSERALANIKAQDTVVEIHRAINNNPDDDVQRQIKEPLGFGRLEKLADKVEEAENSTEEAENFFSPTTSEYQMKKFMNAASGKTAVGIFANATTFNALLQVPEKAAIKDKYVLQQESDTEGKRKPLKLKFGNQISNGILSDAKSLNEKDLKSDTAIAFMSSAVDAEKAQILYRINVNDVTYSTVILLNQLGFDQEAITGFLAQPIMFDLVAAVGKYKNRGFGTTSSLNQAFEEVISNNKYVEEVEETEETEEDEEIDLANIGNYSANKMWDVIDKQEEHPEFKEVQRELVKKFMALQEYANELTSLGLAVGLDSGKTIGKNLFESQAKEENIADVLRESLISNTGNLFGEFYDVKVTDYTKEQKFLQGAQNKELEDIVMDPDWIPMGTKYFKPKTIAGHALAYGLIPNNRLWNQPKFFPYTSKPIKDFTTAIKKAGSKSAFAGIPKAILNKLIFDAAKSYKFSDLTSLGLIDTEVAEDSARLTRLQLLTGANTLQEQISKFKDTKFYLENPFLNKLSVKARKGSMAVINFNQKIEDPADKLKIYTGIIELLNDTTPLPDKVEYSKTGKKKIIKAGIVKGDLVIKTKRDLAMALVAYQYAVGGIQGYTQFLRYIPIDFLKKIGFTESLRNENFNTLLKEGQGENKETFSQPYAAIQFFQHNPHFAYNLDAKEITKKNAKKVRDITRFSFPGFKGRGKNKVFFKPFVTLMNKEGTFLFMYNGNEYVKLDRLGDRNIKEYQKGEMTRSVLSNNVAQHITYEEQIAANSEFNDVVGKTEKIKRNQLNTKYGLVPGEVSISNTLNKIAGFSSNEAHRALAQDLTKVFNEDSGYTLELSTNPIHKGSHNVTTKVITINPDNLLNEEDYTKTILHEILHMLTVETLENPKTEAEKRSVKSLNRLFRAYQKTIDPAELNKFLADVKTAKESKIPANFSDDELSRIYPAISLREFVAAFMTDADTQNHLDKVQFNDEVSFNKELETRLKKLLVARGLSTESTVSKAIGNVLTLMKYNPERNKGIVAQGSKSTSSLATNIKSNKATGVIDATISSYKQDKAADTAEDSAKEATGEIAPIPTEEPPEVAARLEGGLLTGGIATGNIDDLLPAQGMSATLPDLDLLPAQAADLEAKVTEIINNKDFIKLSDDGKTYVNTNTGQEYDRVTNYISDTEVDEDNELLKSSQIIGTKIDELVRDFFAGTLKEVQEYNVSSNTNIKVFLKQLQNLKDKFDASGETVLANDIILYNDELGLAGTVDLLTYDKAGKFHIYDMKTMRGNNFTQSYVGETVNKYDSTKYGESKRVKHQKQLSMYRLLLNNTHGVKAVDLEIIPIEIGYKAKSKATTKMILHPNIVVKPLNTIKKAILDKNATLEVKFEKGYVESATKAAAKKAAKTVEISLKDSNPIIQAKRNLISDHYKKLARLRKRLDEIIGIDEASLALSNKLYLESQEVENEIASIEKEIMELKSESLYSGLYEGGVVDLDFVDALVSQDLDADTLPADDIILAERYIDLWKNFANSEFSKSSDPNKQYRTRYLELKNKAEDLEEKLYDHKRAIVKKIIVEEFPEISPAELADLFEATNDISFLGGKTLDVSKADNTVLQAVSKIIQAATNDISEEVSVVADRLEPLLTKAERALKSKGLTWDIFRQTTTIVAERGEEKTLNSGKLVTLYSQKFWSEKQKISNKAFSEEATAADKKNYKDWVVQNELIINPENIDEQNIIKNVGQASLENIKKEVEEQKARYKRDKERYIFYLEDKGFSKDLKEEKLSDWVLRFNPVTYNKYENASSKYVVTVPRKVNTRGNETGFYDANFAVIQADADLKAFHEYTLNTFNELRRYIPGKVEPINTIPLIQKTLGETAKGKGGTERLSLYMQAWKKSLRGDGLADSYVIDKLTEGRSLSPSYNQSLNRKTEDVLNYREIMYKQENPGKAPTPEMLKIWRAEIINELSEEHSFDLGRIIKTYASTALAYKHKSQVEAPLRIIEQIFEKIEEKREGYEAPQSLDEITNDQVTEQGLKHYKEMLESTLNKFFGKGEKASLKVGKEKSYTKDEKTQKESYEKTLEGVEKTIKQLEVDYKEGIISKEDYEQKLETENKNKVYLERKLSTLGGKVAGSAVIGQLQTYTQLLGMGWNGIAGAANLLFGQIVNSVEGVGGQFYTMKQYRRAFSKVLHNTASLGGAFNTPEGNKIRVLARRWDVLKKSSEELFKQKTSRNRLLDILNPYKIQDTTEFLNQAPIMVLMQEKTSILIDEEPLIVNGEEINWYNAYDANGEWRTDLGINEQDVKIKKQKNNLKAKINSIVRNNHGNYDSKGASMQLKDAWGGRLLAQFRSWMFEGFASRFEGAYYDHNLDMMRKGRYVSAKDFLMAKGKWSSLSRLDKQNMHKVFTEVGIYLNLFGATLLLKAAIEDEDDEEKLSMLRLLTNLTFRLNTDIAFYTNPGDFEALTKSTIPAAMLLSNSINLINSSARFLMGDDEINAGVNSGDSRLFRDFLKMIPGGSTVQKVKSAGRQLYK